MVAFVFPICFNLNLNTKGKMNHNRFSNAAATYNQHASPQQKLVELLLAHAPSKKQERILDVGVGTGLLTKELAKIYTSCPIDGIDLADKMLEICKEQTSNHRQINLIKADAAIYQSNDSYTLIASSAALHWSKDLTDTFINLYNLLKPGGHFLFGLMLNGTLEELRVLRDKIAPKKKIIHKLPTKEKVEKSIGATGFEIVYSDQIKWKQIYPSTKSFLKAIHEQGVTSLSKNDLPLNRSELMELVKQYERGYSNIDGTKVIYETAQYLLKKPEKN